MYLLELHCDITYSQALHNTKAYTNLHKAMTIRCKVFVHSTISFVLNYKIYVINILYKVLNTSGIIISCIILFIFGKFYKTNSQLKLSSVRTFAHVFSCVVVYLPIIIEVDHYSLFITRSCLFFYFVFCTCSICLRNIYRLQMALAV